jgi:hypothetical protein
MAAGELEVADPNPLNRRCSLCGAQPAGLVEVSLYGEITCAGHAISGRCVFCYRPHAQAHPPGWRRFTSSQLRCPTCSTGAVEDQEQAHRWLPIIRREMAMIGVSLPTRVLVRLVNPDQLDPSVHTSAQGVLLGVTRHISRGDQGLEVVEIRIAGGQPPLQFGSAVAHEIGHAWLTQHGNRRPELDIEEGFCELFAHGWLKQQRTPLADELRRRIRENPDPIYGEGFRKVHASATQYGVSTVMESLARHGRLPT